MVMQIQVQTGGTKDRVCLNVAGRDSRVEVAGAGAGAGKGRGCELGSRVNINHQI